MILQRLLEYADSRMKLPPVMYGEVPIKWLIALNSNGQMEGFVNLAGKAKADRKGRNLSVPTLRKTSGIKPRLLADNGEYVLGDHRRDEDPTKVAKVKERHKQFVELVKLCADETNEDSVGAIVKFLDEWSFSPDDVPDDMEPQDTMTFRVGGIVPASELESVQRFWSSYTVEANEKKSGQPQNICLVTGNFGPVEKRMPVPVKGLLRIGGKAENSLVTANEAAFESYGLENSLTSPISRDAGERFGKALNELLAGEKSSVFVGNVAYVFWTRAPSELDIGMFMERPDPDRVRHLVRSAESGRYSGGGAGANCFYALALSASGGRAVVRDWLETTVPKVERNLGTWFRAQEVVGYGGEERASPLGVYRLASSAYRDANKEMQPAVSATMIRVALNGGRLPSDLLARAVRRCVVGTARQDGTREHVTRERAALIKLIFSTQGRLEMGEMKSLSEEPGLEKEDGEAYACGRLLAELEGVQKAALGRINATITDRYYGAASSTPASVFGMLVGDAQSHLSKLRKTKPGVHSAVQERLEEIMSGLRSYPKTLTMERQGLFALGYYHQRASNRAAARAASEARENGENPSPDGEES